MSTLTSDLLEGIVAGAKELSIEYIERLKEEYSGLGYKQRHISDEDHAKWFYMMASQNPNWVAALPYVEGGMKELKRFKKTVGLE